MALSLTESALVATVSYALWFLLRPYVVKSCLQNIPGPKSTSWWKGESDVLMSEFEAYSPSEGNFHQVFDRNGWQFHDMLLKKFGSIVKINMLFGVC